MRITKTLAIPGAVWEIWASRLVRTTLLTAFIALITPQAFSAPAHCAFSPELRCSDSQSGEKLWSDPRYRDPHSFVPGESQVFVSHSTYSSSHDAVTGALLWQQNSGTDGQYFYPVVNGENVYLARSDGILESRSKLSGELVWSRTLANGWIYPPLVLQDKIITGGRDRMIWILDRHSGDTRNTITLDQELVAPLFQAGNAFIASTFDNQLKAYAMDAGAKQPELLWKIKLGAPAFSSLSQLDQLIVADMGGNLHAIDPETGHINWEKPVHENALFWNVIYEQNLISLSATGSLNILDIESGQLKTSLQLNQAYIQAPIVQDDLITLYDIRGAVQYINPDTLTLHSIPPSLTLN